MSRSELRGASWWQFAEMVDGYVRANSPPDKNGLSAAEEDALYALATMQDG